jgi:hypothetical protein
MEKRAEPAERIPRVPEPLTPAGLLRFPTAELQTGGNDHTNPQGGKKNGKQG